LLIDGGQFFAQALAFFPQGFGTGGASRAHRVADLFGQHLDAGTELLGGAGELSVLSVESCRALYLFGWYTFAGQGKLCSVKLNPEQA
jgi:hypothetical protein